MKVFSWFNKSTTQRRLHGALTLAWIAMVPVALLTSLKTSLVFIVLVSLYANIASEWATWMAAKVEVKVDIESGEIEVESDDLEVGVATKPTEA